MIVARALFHWWWLLIICLAIGCGGALIATQQFPPLYAATASVQLDVPSVRTSSVIQPLAAYALLVSSDGVLHSAFTHFSVDDRQILSSRQVIVTSDTASQTISIRVVLKNASLSAQFANMLAQTLVEQQNSSISQEYGRELQSVKNRLNADQHQLDDLNQRYEKASPTHPQPLQQLSDEIAQQQNRENQDYLLQQNLQSEQALVGTPFSIVQQATAPGNSLSPVGSLLLWVLSAGLSLVGGGIFIGFLEKQKAWIYNPTILQTRTGLVVLGNLDWLQKEGSMAAIQEDMTTPLLEDSRLLLANTLLLAEETQARLLTITGLQDSLDSSMIALHLARLLAQCRRNVLLVDANLAHPMQHIWNEKPLQGGLVELLEFAQDADRDSIRGKGQFRPKIREPGVSPIGRYLQRTTLPGLQLLPAGQAQRDPATILGMSALPQLLHQALNFVDFVIIDCPSFSQAEVHLLGASSDQLLLVVNSACNRLPQIEQAIENFSQAGVKPGGLIVVQSRLNHRFQAGGGGSL